MTYKEYTVQFGQSVFDLAINLYGDLSRVWDIIDDNNFGAGLDTDLEGGQVILIREQFINNNITEYFKRFPVFVNNSDYEDTGISTALLVTLKQIVNEDKGGDGYILISVSGGKAPFSFAWRNEANQIISTQQNLVAANSGTYSVTVSDAEGVEVTLSNLTISVKDNTVYLVDNFGNFVTDEFGNFIIVSQ